MQGTQWAVFEPNDIEPVGRRQAQHVGLPRRGLWRDGALFGATPEQAFYVKCDAETNPPGSRSTRARSSSRSGIAPVKPAEFVIFHIRQIAPGEGGGGGEA